MTSTNAAITELRKTIDINSSYKTMRSVPDTSLDEHGNACSAPSYQWVRTIGVACQNFRRTLIACQRCNEVLDWGFRNNLVENVLPNQTARLNRMHREISGIDGLMHVADGIDLIFRYRRYWTVDKMHLAASSAVSILWLVRDLQRVCQRQDWLIKERAPFLAYKVDILLRRHQLRGLRGTTRLGYRRYGCAPHRTQDLMVQLQEYYRVKAGNSSNFLIEVVVPDLSRASLVNRRQLD